jgi:hypothetical protein
MSHRPRRIPRGGLSRMVACPRSTRHQTIASPGHGSPVRRADIASSDGTGWAAERNEPNSAATDRVRPVERNRRRRDTGTPRASARASLFARAHRTLLLESPQIRVRFARDDRRVRAFEDEIDDAVQRVQERADDRRLDVVSDRGTRAREEPHARVHAERRCKPGKTLRGRRVVGRALKRQHGRVAQPCRARPDGLLRTGIGRDPRPRSGGERPARRRRSWRPWTALHRSPPPRTIGPTGHGTMGRAGQVDETPCRVAARLGHGRSLLARWDSRTGTAASPSSRSALMVGTCPSPCPLT